MFLRRFNVVSFVVLFVGAWPSGVTSSAIAAFMPDH
jgi:hypothetical protein